MASSKVVSFDADQTLFDFNRTINEALQEVSDFLAREHHLSISPQVLKETRNRIFASHKDAAIDMLTLRRMSFSELLEGQNRANIVDDAMKLFEEVRFGRIYLYPHVERVIRELSTRYTLAVITNGNSDPDRTSLAGLFDHIILGEKFIFKKPDHRIFEQMFKLANVHDPASFYHVGDSLLNDVKGANGVGSVSVWFNPEGLPNLTEIVPQYEIQSMPELLEILR